jgi:uncharacterized membrane protein SpoIIM required for sporulation
MRQTEFEQQHRPLWQRFERWLDVHTQALRRRPPAAPDELTAADVPATYRAICSHLALARERQYGPSLVEHLNHLVLRGHHALYASAPPGGRGLLHFVAAGFPALVRREWRVIGCSFLLFFGPLFGLMAAVQIDPEFAAVVIPAQQLEEMQAMYQPDNRRLGRRDATDDVQMFGFYVWNNVRIGFQTFAGGAFVGLGTLFFLLFNGVFIGAVLGHLTEVGLGPQIWSFVSGHSAFELGGIVVSGAGGLKIGAAMIAPGLRSRRAALVADGAIAFRLAGGAALMFFAAAAIEGFWSPHQFVDVRVKYAVGIALVILTLAYFGLAGRGESAADPERAAG